MRSGHPSGGTGSPGQKSYCSTVLAEPEQREACRGPGPGKALAPQVLRTQRAQRSTSRSGSRQVAVGEQPCHSRQPLDHSAGGRPHRGSGRTWATLAQATEGTGEGKRSDWCSSPRRVRGVSRAFLACLLGCGGHLSTGPGGDSGSAWNGGVPGLSQGDHFIRASVSQAGTGNQCPWS